MSQPTETKASHGVVREVSHLDDKMVELRRLLLGPWQNEVSKLQQRLDDPALHARDVSGILPEAVVLRSGQDGKLAKALVPTVEEILKTSVERNPHILVNALFPVMGPSIRKAIFETIKQMIQSFDQIIGGSFSWQGIKWRVEAFRTGTSFGEVVLRHSLLYQVEQVFLIHKETGLLLQHVLAGSVAAREPDMVSGMLTAIQDFVQDSFTTEKQDTLDLIQMGELTIWVEQGPLAVIAGVIRGTPPEKLRLLFNEALENIHLEQFQALEAFEGDATPFQAARHHLESCLQAQYKRRKQKVSLLSLAVVGGLVLAAVYWTFDAFQSRSRWAAFLDTVRSIPGIVVTESEKRGGKYFVSGLRDPLAADPLALLEEKKIDPTQVVFHWEPYFALNDRFILIRARQVLNPPETVSLSIENGVLTATGSAPHEWIHEFQAHHSLPGIVRFNDQDLIDLELQQITTLKEQIEKTVICFETNTTRIIPDQGEPLNELIGWAQQIQSLSRLTRFYLQIAVIGHSDTSGVETKNMKLSQQRAQYIMSLLISQGIDPANLTETGIGSKELVRKELSEQDRVFNRSTTFRVTLKPSTGKEN